MFFCGKNSDKKKKIQARCWIFILLLIHHYSTDNRGHVTSVEPKANTPLWQMICYDTKLRCGCKHRLIVFFESKRARKNGTFTCWVSHLLGSDSRRHPRILLQRTPRIIIWGGAPLEAQWHLAHLSSSAWLHLWAPRCWTLQVHCTRALWREWGEEDFRGTRTHS